MDANTLWNTHKGRELDATPLFDRALPHRIVGCLNVWNDRDVLRLTVSSWKDVVDHVIVVDGSYDTTGRSELSTDGTREYLAAVFPSIEFVNRPGVSQCAKRTAYLEHGRVNDYLFVIDADERLIHNRAFDSLPSLEIGWLRIQSTLYAREYGQPRVFKWRPGLRYEGRHHWMYCNDRLFCTHQYGGTGFVHRPLDAVLMNDRSLGRSRERLQVKGVNLRVQHAVEAKLSAAPHTVMSDSAVQAREALHIVNYVFRDDGLAPSRFHTAINRTTPHSSTFFKLRSGPFNAPSQHLASNQQSLSVALLSADVVHVHSLTTLAYPPQRRIPLVLHHHGSRLRENAEAFLKEAKLRRAIVLVANLELLSWTGDYPAEFLPNAMPVGRYLSLANHHRTLFDGSRPFRIAHSPTHRQRKGTERFLDVCERLQHRGYPLEVVLIEGVTHERSLEMKASCHAMFDSFWLGIQCSGLEAASMHLPVIAGDHTVATRYKEHFGYVPYTFADTEDELEAAIARLIDDPQFYQDEVTRVFNYVVAHHDESAVALTYLDQLDRAFQWRTTPRKRAGVKVEIPSMARTREVV